MSWDELRAIAVEAKTVREELRAQPLVDCPVCGTVLDTNSRGEKNCPLGHYRAPAGTTKGSAGEA